MTLNDLNKAVEGIEQEINNCHYNLLNARADLAADMSDPELEAAFRWLADNSKWPQMITREAEDTTDYVWYGGGTQTNTWDCELPREIHNELNHRTFNFRNEEKPSKSCTEAINDAAQAVKTWLKRGSKDANAAD